MRKALALAREQGELQRQPGGYWTVPGEPMHDGKRGPRAGRERHVGTQTVRALVRRRHLERTGYRVALLVSPST